MTKWLFFPAVIAVIAAVQIAFTVLWPQAPAGLAAVACGGATFALYVLWAKRLRAAPCRACAPEAQGPAAGPGISRSAGRAS